MLLNNYLNFLFPEENFWLGCFPCIPWCFPRSRQLAPMFPVITIGTQGLPVPLPVIRNNKAFVRRYPTAGLRICHLWIVLRKSTWSDGNVHKIKLQITDMKNSKILTIFVTDISNYLKNMLANYFSPTLLKLVL